MRSRHYHNLSTPSGSDRRQPTSDTSATGLRAWSYRKPARLFQASELTVEHPEIRKVTYSNLGGFRFGHSAGTGRIDRRKLDIRSPQVSGYVFRVAATADDIKGVLRRIRPQEAAALDAIDQDIADLQAKLDGLKERRKETLHVAWQRANVVRLKDVGDLLPDSRPTSETQE